MSPLLVDEIQSPIGRIMIAARRGRLCALEFGRSGLMPSLAARFQGERLDRVGNPFGFSQKIRAYFDGDLSTVDDIPVETGGTAFQRRVWRALRRIPPGRTMSYGDLAGALGLGSAGRAVGAANARNPISIVVPCHRLIARDASLTGYAGGLWRKLWLLHHEGAIATLPHTGSSRSRGVRRRGRNRSSSRIPAPPRTGLRR
jgi:methylated-DNA-[protein]-cysteine S-methyltransferase